jgi:hypothetical protein
MSSTSTKKIAIAAAIVLAIGLVACFAFYVWLQSRIPAWANVASIERHYGKQLNKLAEYARDYEHINDNKRSDYKEIERLFSDAAIIEATVWSSNSLNKSGVGMKHSTTSLVGTTCWLSRAPSIENPVVNFWSGGDRQFIEYCASLRDRKGVERSYTIIFDLSKMNGAD